MKKIIAIAMTIIMAGCLVACASSPTETKSAEVANEAAAETKAESKSEEKAAEEDSASADVIKIGVFEPLTGNLAAGGEQDLQAYEFGTIMRPEVLGKKVELSTADNKSDRIEAANAATRLIYDDKVDFILGSYGSSVTNGGADIIEEAGVPTVCNASNINVTQDRFWICRLCYLDNYMGTIMSSFAADELKAKTAVVVRNTSEDYSVGVASWFEDDFKKRTGNDGAILETIDYTSNDQDFTGIISSIQTINPDTIFMPGFYSDVGLFCSQLRAAGIETPVLAADGIMNNEFVDIAGEAAEGVYCNANFNIAAGEDNPLAKEFVDNWRKQYGVDPTSDNAVCYANYTLLCDAIEAVGDASDKEGIMNWMRNLDNYQTLLGTVTMDPDLATPKTRTGCIMQVQNGSFQYVMSITP